MGVVKFWCATRGRFTTKIFCTAIPYTDNKYRLLGRFTFMPLRSLVFCLITFVTLIWPLAVVCQTSSVKDSLEVHKTDTIYFPFASAELTEAANTQIKKMIADRPGELYLYLEGHTDAVGTKSANEDLAEQRSLATRAAFTNGGWPNEAVELRHFGERRLAINTNAKEVRNRRVLMRSGLPKRYALLSGTIRDEDGQPIPGGAIAHGTYLKDTVTADQSGRFSVWLPMNDSVTVDVFAQDHFIQTHNYFIGAGTPPPARLEVTLQRATPGRRFDINDLYFVHNKTKFLPGGIESLERLYHFMDYNSDIRIELAGHVNFPGGPQPPKSWAHNLAGARAKTVYDYLVNKGIPSNRMRYRSYSNYEMIVPGAKTEPDMRQNRRVEVRIVDIK